MTPKEKARELVVKFQKQIFFNVTDERLDINEAKGLSIIAVDEILINFGLRTNGKMFYTEYGAVKYWELVKIEIEKL